MKKILLSASGVCKSFGTEKNLVLNHVDTDIYEGDFTIIMGASGAGKSTLLYALSGMDRITGGRIVYKNQEIGRAKEKEMAKLRALEFGFVFQQTHLVSNLTLLENVEVAGFLGNSSGQNRRAGTESIKKRAVELLKRVHVELAKDRLPAEVSGGEAQRAAIARAIINHPGVLFADEPTGALNKRNTTEVLKLLTDLNRQGQSILMVTHDLKAALRGNRILYLEDGEILDEMELPPFAEENVKEREKAVNEWLSSMEW